MSDTVMSEVAPPECLAGGGEMGALMRSIDWAHTPVGPVDAWPPSLKAILGLLLSSESQLCVLWGPELVQFYNDAFRPILGSTKHPRAMGQRARECWSEIWSVIEPMYAKVLAGGSTSIRDGLLVLDRHGFLEECYFDYTYSPLRDDASNIAGILAICSEVTDRVLGERRLRALRALAECTSKAKTSNDACRLAADVLAEHAADVPFALVYLLDRDGQRAQLAGAAGLPSETGASAETIDVGGDGQDIGWPLGEVVRTGKGVHVDDLARRFGPLPNRDGVPAPQSALVLPIGLPGDARLSGVLVVGLSSRLRLDDRYRSFLDLVAGHIGTAIASARALAEAEERAEALAQLDRAKTAFFSNVSHEFRTPLTLMLGPLEELLSTPIGLLDAREAQDRIAVAHRNALRMLKLVNTLLEFSRIESGRVQAVYEPTDIGAYTAELASAFRSIVERAGLRFVVDCPPGILDGVVDRDMWEKIVFNLLSNAFKHTFTGEIRVSIRPSPGLIDLTVADTGTGIAANDLPHLFERFHRIRNARARTHEGTGIGLALVAELVRLHGGTVRVTSELDRGTTFVVSIPQGAGHLPQERIGAHRTSPTSTALDAAPYIEEAQRWVVDDGEAPLPIDAAPTAELRGGRIVLADDNADMRDYVRRLLSEFWEVEAVGDGSAALAAIRERPPELVITDVMMPGLDGFELLRALRSDPQTSTIPVVLLSARAGEESRIEGLDAGADDYLVKPFSARELVARVSTHLKMAAARRRFATALETERAKLETVLRQMPAGVVIVDAVTGQFVLTNHQAARILGIAVSSESTDSFPEDRVLRADGTRYPRDDWPVIRSLRTGEVVADEEVRFVRGDGAVVTLAVSSAPVSDHDGRTIAAVVVFQDITERLALLAREQAARNEADTANRAKDRFLAVLSHELRVPLTAIMGWSRLLRNSRLSESERAHAISVIERNTERQAALVKDLLDVARISAGKLELDRLPVDLVVITRDALDSINTELRTKQLELTVDLDPSSGEVFGDALRLQQVVVNLLANAAKFTPEAGRIAVRLGRHGEMARLTVADSGEGIDPSLLPHIFEPFQQGEQRVGGSARHGLGLGLTIVRELVGLHGGTIRAESPGKGKGATFTVELPVIAVRVSPTRSTPGALETSDADTSVQARLSDVRVLIVDDQPDARELLAFVLEQHGARTHMADSAQEALDILAQIPIDVIVSDLAMPAMDGYGLITAVRSSQRQRNVRDVRAIALTAYKGREMRDRAVAAGFDAHATKPIDPDELVNLVASLAANRRAPGGDT